MDDSVRVVELHRAAEHHAAADLFARIWKAESTDAVAAPSLMTAIAHAGGYVAGAYLGDQLIGAALGFLGAGHLHSHVAGVDPAAQRRGLGYLLKQHQREWCLARGIGEIRWTYDPLIARNAYFNLHRLGAHPVQYLPDFYGPLLDGINAGDTTDRLYVVWPLADPTPPPSDVDTAGLRAAGATVLVDRVDERPVLAEVDLTQAGPVLVAVPQEAEVLRTWDPALARQWRQVIGVALPAALAAGRRITGISRDAFYILSPTEESA